MSFLTAMVVLKFLKTLTKIDALIILTTNLIMLLVIEIFPTILTHMFIGTQKSTIISIM